jgi:quinoprotein glucose dehydrogenase
MVKTERSLPRRFASRRTNGRGRAHVVVSLLAVLAACGDAPPEEGAHNAAVFRGDVETDFRLVGDWPAYHGDPGGMRYSPLIQIHAGNVGNLTRAWTYALGERTAADRSAEGWQATPLVVGGTMYLAAADRIVALQPETGNELWRHRLGTATAPSRRGVVYWPGDRNTEARVYFTTAGARLVALSARTGRRVSSFGSRGEVAIAGHDGGIAVPVVFRDLVVVAAGTGSAGVSAFDARSGARRWIFHPWLEADNPAPEHSGAQSREPVAAEERDRAAEERGRRTVPRALVLTLALAQAPDDAPPSAFAMTVDVDRGLLFVTFAGMPPASTGALETQPGRAGSPFANAVVALDAYTGALRWRFQTVRGDRWGYEPPAPPALLDVSVNGRERPLLALVGPSGHMYLLDRPTGEPFYDVEERLVPAPPGLEAASLTDREDPDAMLQRVPVGPPLARLRFEAADLVTAADTNEAHAAYCAALAESSASADAAAVLGEASPAAAAPAGAPLFPGIRGAVGWGGTSVDPRLGYVFVNTMDLGDLIGSAPAPQREQLELGPGETDVEPAVAGRAFFAWDGAVGSGESAGDRVIWPCQKPPWGRLLAVDALTGQIAWQVPLGITEGLSLEKRHTGRPNEGGALTTAGGLIFIGAADDRRFRAFDSRTGSELWAAELGMSAHAVPMSYQGRDGKQYVAVTAAGGVHRADGRTAPSLVVFALP